MEIELMYPVIFYREEGEEKFWISPMDMPWAGKGEDTVRGTYRKAKEVLKDMFSRYVWFGYPYPEPTPFEKAYKDFKNEGWKGAYLLLVPVYFKIDSNENGEIVWKI